MACIKIFEIKTGLVEALFNRLVVIRLRRFFICSEAAAKGLGQVFWSSKLNKFVSHRFLIDCRVPSTSLLDQEFWPRKKGKKLDAENVQCS